MALSEPELIKAIAELKRRESRNKIAKYFPDSGPLRRELYPKHIQFFAAGADYRQRLMLAANRIGKTESVGLYELVIHMTGKYPHWWAGRRFTKPIKAWAAGDTKQTVREILQDKLMGAMGNWGTGLIPGDLMGKITLGGGSVAGSVESVTVKHASGGYSTVTLKSYDQGRKAFQGTEQDIILLDEEPPMDVYTECLIRTMTNNGMLMLTFTPLTGMSEVVLAFLPGGELQENQNGSKFVVMATWDDAPHLSDDVKKELWESIPPFQRDARSKGVPQLGAGAIYPVPESEIIVPDFEIPKHWPRSYGLDVGWNRTAAVWSAIDRDAGIVYMYREHYKGNAEPVIHAEGIKAPGAWIPGVIDPAARGRGQKDGEKLLDVYRNLGLDLEIAINAVESGVYETWQRLSSGRLKIFASLNNWRAEYRLYRRDEKGKIVKENDHLMDAMRYNIMSGLDRAKAQPIDAKNSGAPVFYNSGNWMG